MSCDNFIVCRLIINKMKDEKKYPNLGCNSGYTPLHFAALHGMEDVCQLIIENIENKIPQKLVSTYMYYETNLSEIFFICYVYTV